MRETDPDPFALRTHRSAMVHAMVMVAVIDVAFMVAGRFLDAEDLEHGRLLTSFVHEI